jgi:putative ABC transport system permease protein
VAFAITMALANDIRYALRQLRNHPGLTVVVVATLGLCIGANAAIYSVLDAVLLRPLPYPEPDRLAMVITADPLHEGGDPMDSQTGSLFEAVRIGTPGLDAAASAGQGGVNFVDKDNGYASFVQQQRVSAGYFRVLGVAPWKGREFTRAEDVPNGPARAIVSYDFWRHVLHGDGAVIGRNIKLRGQPYQIIGVIPRGFRGPSQASVSDPSKPPVDLWTPLQPTAGGEGGGANYHVIARLKPGVSWPEATGQLQALSRGLMQMPDFPKDLPVFEERIVPLQSGLTHEVRRELFITWAAVLVVLLIGCVNIAGLLMARAPARAREIATRLALGGGRTAIVRQLLVESLVLSIGGCGAGLLLGGFAVDWLKSLGATNFEVAQPIQLDVRVMAVMFGVAIVTSVLFGLVPAIQISRLDIRSVLVESGRGIASGRGRHLRNVLVAAEVALSLVLLVAAGLLIRTMDYFHGLNAGFDSRNLLVAESSLLDARYEDRDSITRLYDDALARIRAIQGVKHAAVTLSLPYERPLNYGYKQLDGFSGPPPDGKMTEMVYVTPDYFETLGIPLLRGRTFRESDTQQNAHVAIVSESFAISVFKGVDAALGRHISIRNVPCEIAGVVGDVQQHSGLELASRPISVEPTVYAPMAQSARGFLYFVHRWYSPKWVVRSTVSPARLVSKIQEQVAAVDRELPVSGFRTMDEVEGVYLLQQRYTTALFSMMAALALALAAIGLYGLISNTIAQRMHELGVRMALGATATQIVAATVRPGVLLALAGVASGALLARAAARLLDSMLWGVQPGDPVTFAATAVVLLIVAVAASLVPCLRILHLDPARTLHTQ